MGSVDESFEPDCFSDFVRRLGSHTRRFLEGACGNFFGHAADQSVNQVQEKIAARLHKLGFNVEWVENPMGSKRSGTLLIGTRVAKSRTDTKFVTFVMHADTVFEPSSGFTKWIQVDPDTVNGPGVIDDKGGVVVALTGLEQYLSKHPDTPLSFRVVSSPSEETGSIGFTDLFGTYAKSSRLILGFEPATDDGSVISDRKGNFWFTVHVTGREAHAGHAHREGVNACYELALKLAKLSKLTDYSKDVTASIGHMDGGKDKFNIVCGTAQAKIDTRFPSMAERNRLKEKIDRILKTPEVRSAADGKATEISYEVANDCPPMTSTPQSREVASQYAVMISSVEGKTVHPAKEGSSSDSAYFAVEGVDTIDGLGAVGLGMHTPQEKVFLPSLVSRAQALSLFLEKLAH